MAKSNSTGDGPLRETEEAAYHAYREWPVWLALREKELQALKQPSGPAETNHREENAPEGQEREKTKS
jgi:hypothetical protein